MRNKKISLSLLAYHRRKKRNKEIKVILWILLIISCLATHKTHTILKATEAKAPETIYLQELPESKDNKNIPVEIQIRRIAEKENFKWIDYLIRLARCENDTFNPERHNEIPNVPVTSKDHGIFMINDYWHAEVPHSCSHNVECATLWTINRINNGYQHEWSCDKLI